MKPLFDEERHWLQRKLDIEVPAWSWRKRQTILSPDLHPLYRLRVASDLTIEVAQQYPRPLPWNMSWMDHVTRAIHHLESLQAEAFVFLRSLGDMFPGTKIYVGFSGGKDSMVVADLVRRAGYNWPLIFQDTKIEMASTYALLRQLRGTEWDFKWDKSAPAFFPQVFSSSPPTKWNRWCCGTQKHGVATKREAGHDVIFISGIRRDESTKRAGREAIVVNHHRGGVEHIEANVILDWTETDIWLYTLWRDLPINEAYKRGWRRVGCYMCPYGGRWNEVLGRYWEPARWKVWDDIMARFLRQMFDLDWYQTGSDAWERRYLDAVGSTETPLCVKCRNPLSGIMRAENKAAGRLNSAQWLCRVCLAEELGFDSPKKLRDYFQPYLAKRPCIAE